MKLLRKYFKSYIIVFSVFAIFAFDLAGCTSGSSDLASEDSGEVIISLTDAAGDFSSYTVDVLSLNLTKANGAQVTVLPLSTRIDFAQYTEMTEFLTAATVPSGVYVSATLVLDFQNADIWVEDENGNDVNVDVANIVDENGNTISTLEVSVQLEDKNKLAIAPGIPVHLMLDFDLQASNQVSFDTPEEPVLTVDPFLVADVDRSNQHKIHRVRGLLNDVDLDASSFSLILRPFYCALTDNHRQYGIRSVITNDDTLFNIDGETYQGSDGLIAIDALDSLTPVVALGDLRFEPLRFEAREVYAGSSVPGATLDAVSGWVTQRTGDTLTVKGASLIRNNASFIFNDEVTLLVAETTVVTRQISSDTYNKDDISIGQHITAFGTITNLNPANLEINATQGFVRMMMTTVRGAVVSLDDTDPVAQMTIDLQSIGKFRVGTFDFSGTGIDSEHDADPDNYDIFTGDMTISGITETTPVKLKGFVEPFGMAPPDFSAYTLIDVADLKAFIKVNWEPPTDMPFTLISSEELIFNLEGTGKCHYLVRGCVVTDLLLLPNQPMVIPDEDGEGLYILKYNGVTEIHTVFADFSVSLEELLEEGYNVQKFNSVGVFDDSTSTQTADMIEIRLN